MPSLPSAGARGVPASPTLQLLLLFFLLFLGMRLAPLVGLGPEAVALSLPLAERPWTVVTSIYAHASLGHLLANSIALLLVGLAIERFTTRARFHAFVLGTGAVSGVSQVVVGGLLGSPAAVLGASGAILALYGYVLAGNSLASGLLARSGLGRRGKLVLLAGAVLGVVLVTGGRNVALVAHVVGFLSGVGAGRVGLLRP